MGKRIYSHSRAKALAGTLVTTLLTLFCLFVTGTVNAHGTGVSGTRPVVSNISTIIYNHAHGPQPDWSMHPLIDPGLIHTQQAETGYDRPMGLCFEVPPSKGAKHQLVNFACRGCPHLNKPFVPKQTSGIAAWMSEANKDSTGVFSVTSDWPDAQLQFLSDVGEILCDIPFLPKNKVLPPHPQSGLIYGQALYQNAPECHARLAEVAGLNLVIPAAAQKSGAVCLDRLTLLPSHLEPGPSERELLALAPNCTCNCVAAACRAASMLTGWSQQLTDIKASVQKTGPNWEKGDTVGTGLTASAWVLGVGLAVAAWFAAFVFHWASKTRLVDEVVDRVTVEDVHGTRYQVTDEQVAESSADASTSAEKAKKASLMTPERKAKKKQKKKAKKQRKRAEAKTRAAGPKVPPSGSILSTDSAAVPTTPPPSEKQVKLMARQIVWRCLSQWDSSLGLNIGPRGKAGIWRNRFESVRCSALLKALQNAARHEQTKTPTSESLFVAWETAATRPRQLELVLEMADQLLNVDLKPLRSLPRSTKDPADQHHPIWTIIGNKATRLCESGAGVTTPTESVSQAHDANGLDRPVITFV